MSDVSYAGPLNQWLAQAPPQPPPRVMGKSLAKLLEPYLTDSEQAQDAAEAAAQRVRAPYAAANARESGLPDVGRVLGNKLVNTLMAGPNLMGQVAEGSIDPNSPEGIRRATDVASSTLGWGMLGARPGAAGMAGGKLRQPSRDPSLTPAISHNGKVYAADEGGTHLDALSKVPQEDRAAATLNGDNRVYVTQNGRVLDRWRGQDFAVKNDLLDPNAPDYAKRSPELIGEWLRKPEKPIGAPHPEVAQTFPEATINQRGDHVLPLAGGKGAVEFKVDPNTVTMSASYLDKAEQGKGIASDAYRRIVDWALASGRDVKSHGAPQPDARRLYESLANKGYQVERNKNLAGQTEYRVTGGPKTGTLSDFITAYHGSPHDFDRFDLSKIGTGEGAQAYGHGLYFAEAEGTAKAYRDALQQSKFQSLTPAEDQATGLIKPALDQAHAKGGPEAASRLLDQYIVNSRRHVERAPGEGEETTLAALEKLKANGDYAPKLTGKMYQVAIKAPPESFLDWDKPLSEQSPKVQQYIRERAAAVGPDEPGPRRGGKHILQSMIENNASGGDLYGRLAYKQGAFPEIAVQNHEAATKALREAGIPGIKYLDQGSRNTVARPELVTNADGTQQWATKSATGVLRRFSSKEAADKFWQSAEDKGRTRNFVVFDDKLVDILKKYGVAGIGALPAMNAFHYQDKGS